MADCKQIKQGSYLSSSPEETIQLAKDFSKQLLPGDVVALSGELGAGKTCFAKGVISQLTGISEHEITSPTFTLIEAYEARFPIYHVDLYRIESQAELENLDLEELFAKNSIALIEWPEKLKDLNKHCQYEVKILNIKAKHKREIQFIKKENHEFKKILTH